MKKPDKTKQLFSTNAEEERMERIELINIQELLSQFEMADSQCDFFNKRMK